MYVGHADSIDVAGLLALSDRPVVGLSIRPRLVQDDSIDIAWETDMDTLFSWFIIIAALLAFDLGALSWGVDSRDRLPDDHRR
jgi:hypothetical protein